MESIVNTVLKSMSNVNLPQRKFIGTLMIVLTLFRGNATFRNLSRYSGLCEKTYSRWYRRDFDFPVFNMNAIRHHIEGAELIAAIDASFLKKAGKHTEGLGYFYNGSASRAEKGLEVSLVCIVDVNRNTAYPLEAKQTIDQSEKSRVEIYAQQVVCHSGMLIKHGIKYIATDAFYTKSKFIAPVTLSGLEIVGKLRVDANLRWIYEGPQSGRGRKKCFDGKIDVESQLEKFDYVGEDDELTDIYTKIVYSVNFKRNIRLVVLRSCNARCEFSSVLLFSTDLDLSARDIIRYYRSRFQIEFLFRDAKQFTGLDDCQSLKSEALHTQVNAALSAIGLLKFENIPPDKNQNGGVVSVSSWKRKKLNEYFIKLIFSKLGVDHSCKKYEEIVADLRKFGT